MDTGSLNELEKKWVDNFKNSHFVDNGAFQSSLAYQLFYGKKENYPDTLPSNFSKLYAGATVDGKIADLTKKLAELTRFLSVVGIRFSANRLEIHIDKNPGEVKSVFKRAHDILKTLAHYEENINVNDPFKDNIGELYFFLRIEMAGQGSGGKEEQLQLFQENDLPVVYRKLSTLPDNYEDDPMITKLFREIETTDKSFFITGKAGTGKSTFIHYFAQKTSKKIIMLAFTGIASINVGGQTIHSFFKFPLKPLLPNDHEIKEFSKGHPTRKVIEKINVIVIDEVSMLRSDIMDAIDYSLRINGGNPKLPFGGKQIIFVGDVFQLPPVVDNNNEVEKVIFTEVYKSEYFFDAHSYRKLNPIYFEFTKVHRQKDDLEFVEMLDKVRVCDIDQDTINRFNKRYYPNYTPRLDEFVITLTTRNMDAQMENASRLENLGFTKFVFEAEITGDFREDRYPTAKVLELKKHAQVIVVKNDLTGRWVNGTIAKIEFISQDRVEVRLQNGQIYQLAPTEWENRKYDYDRHGGRVVSEKIGSFMQYPIKLAWAITVHKSQGLTFDKVVIDMGYGAFVNGQAYTALSRCRSLKGIALKKLLKKEDIIADDRILNFHHTEKLLQPFAEVNAEEG